MSFREVVRKTSKNVKESINGLNRLNPNIMVFIVYGLLYDMVINIYKPFAIKFLDRLGGNEFHIALYNSLPGLVAVLALLPGSFFISRFRNKKNITSVFMLLSRLCILSLAFVPMMPDAVKPMAFVLVISVMNFPEALSQTSLQGFLGRVFDGRVRAQAISLRNKFGNFMIMTITLIMGLVISIFPRTDSERILYYQIFFVAAFFIGLMEIKTFRKFREGNPGRADAPEQFHVPRLGVLKNILKDSKFMRFAITTFIFQLSWHAGWPLGNIFQVKFLQANEIWLAVFAVVTGLSSFLSAGFWSKQISKHGNSKILIMAAFSVAVNMMLFAVTPNLWVMTFVAAYGGFSNIGITVTLLNGLLSATPDEDRILYLGTYNTFINFSLFVSPLVASLMFSKFGMIWSLVVVSLFRIFTTAIIYFAGRKEGANVTQ